MMLDARLVDPLTPVPLCIDVDTACKWIRIDTGNESDSAEVESLIRAAMDLAESRCHQPLFEREYYGYGDSLRNTCLHSLNVTNVSKVEYQVGTSKEWLELDPDDYTFWESGEIFFYRVSGIANVNRIRVTYTAGYPKNAVPHSIIQAVRLLIGRWYDNRADEKKEVPSTADMLIGPHKMPIA